jgi:fumarylacetoacetase
MGPDQTLGTWVQGADASGFGIEHLPFGVIRARGGSPRPAVRIGDRALVLAPLAATGLLNEVAGSDNGGLRRALEAPTLNGLLALGRPTWSQLRARLIDLLGAGNSEVADAGVAGDALVQLSEAEELLPIQVGDYVDFYSSLEHATNVGRLVRPDGDPLFPNWRHLPVGYHGRSANAVVSGTPVRRPIGQTAPQASGGAAGFGPERLLDFELELAFITGPGPDVGERIPAVDAAEHIFGFALVNDWSARSIQAWEYQPLGPFLAKSFATSVGAWITPLEALDSFRVPGPTQDPEPLEYLRASEPRAFDLSLEVALVPAGSCEEIVISSANASWLYWSIHQQLAHATVNGAVVRAGDLFASGTISGSEPGSQGCLLELTSGGQKPLRLGGAERTFLEDGDEVILRGAGAPGEGRPAITLAEVSGRILPASPNVPDTPS